MHLSNMEMVGRPSHEIPPAQKIKMEMIRIRITIRLRLIIMMFSITTDIIIMIISTYDVTMRSSIDLSCSEDDDDVVMML